MTGASGFLGRAVLRHLRQENLSGSIVGASRGSDPGYYRVPRYTDVPVGRVLVHLAEANDRSWVQHAGEPYLNDALETLKYLCELGFRRIVYASSAVLYGDADARPHRTTDPVQATDLYSQLKIESEKIVSSVGGCTARLSNLYGPGMSNQNVVSRVLSQVPGTGALRVHDGAPERDFLWIDDAASAIAVMTRSSISGCFNVGTGIATSVRHLASIALERAGETHRHIQSESLQARKSCIVVDTSVTEATFHWRPAVSVERGIASLVDQKLEEGP